MSYNPLTAWSHGLKWQIKKQNISSSTRPMTTKLGKVVTYNEGNVPIISDDALIRWSCEVISQIENLISPLSQGLWPPNMTECWLTVRGARLWSHVVLWQLGDAYYVTNQKRNISSLAKSMATKLGKLVAYAKAKQPKKSHVPLTTWSYVVMSQTKNKIFFPSDNVWLQKTLQGADVWWVEAHNEVAQLWWRNHKRSSVKLKI